MDWDVDKEANKMAESANDMDLDEKLNRQNEVGQGPNCASLAEAERGTGSLAAFNRTKRKEKTRGTSRIEDRDYVGRGGEPTAKNLWAYSKPPGAKQRTMIYRLGLRVGYEIALSSCSYGL